MNKYAEQLIKKWEGCELTAYQDSAGIWTVGYGHIKGVAKDLNIIQEQANAWLEEELSYFEQGVIAEVQNLSLTDYQIGALISFSYNIGLGAFQESTLLEEITTDKENYDCITREFLKWDNAGGKEVKGLSKRRISEANCYVNSVI